MSEVPATPWQKVTTGKRAQRQEERNGRLPGGSKQLNSGRQWFSKRDNRLGGFLVETRTTERGSYAIQRTEFEQITREAFGSPPGQLPAMQIDLCDSTSTLSLFVTRLEDHLWREAYIGDLEQELKDLRASKVS